MTLCHEPLNKLGLLINRSIIIENIFLFIIIFVIEILYEFRVIYYIFSPFR